MVKRKGRGSALASLSPRIEWPGWAAVKTWPVARSHSSALERALDHLDAYQVTYGDVNVPVKFVSPDGYPLGQWVRDIRTAYRRGKLDPERIAALDEREMVWNAWEAAFQEGLGHLGGYRAANGHARVPQDFVTEDGYRLGNWLDCGTEHLLQLLVR